RGNSFLEAIVRMSCSWRILIASEALLANDQHVRRASRLCDFPIRGATSARLVVAAVHTGPPSLFAWTAVARARSGSPAGKAILCLFSAICPDLASAPVMCVVSNALLL